MGVYLIKHSRADLLGKTAKTSIKDSRIYSSTRLGFAVTAFSLFLTQIYMGN